LAGIHSINQQKAKVQRGKKIDTIMKRSVILSPRRNKKIIPDQKHQDQDPDPNQDLDLNPESELDSNLNPDPEPD
jgi:hypothetical protein